MMTLKFNESLALVEKIESRHLLGKLIQQLNKDAALSGIDFMCAESLSAKELLNEIYHLLLHLMTNDFGSYLNFLYRVDISEQTIKSIVDTDPEKIAQVITLMVLKREWQKVFFRNKNQ